MNPQRFNDSQTNKSIRAFMGQLRKNKMLLHVLNLFT